MDVVTKLAGHLKLSELVVGRILGSTRVLDGKEIGINVREPLKSGPAALQIQQAEGLEALCAVLEEYKRVCPAVVSWLHRGDFNTDKIPSHITKSQIVHACRTAGRLRAQVMRSLMAAW